MKPQPAAEISSPWQRKFAWRPVRGRTGRWLWLTTVLERETQVSFNTISVSKIVKEYDTPSHVVSKILSGEDC